MGKYEFKRIHPSHCTPVLCLKEGESGVVQRVALYGQRGIPRDIIYMGKGRVLMLGDRASRKNRIYPSRLALFNDTTLLRFAEGENLGVKELQELRSLEQQLETEMPDYRISRTQ